MSEHNHEHAHHHHDGCDCGCDHDHEHEATVTLTLDDGNVLECAVLTIFPAGDKEYIALLPISEEDEEAGDEVYLYRFIQNGEDEPSLENIEDDDEYEIVADAFDEILDNAEFDEEELED